MGTLIILGLLSAVFLFALIANFPKSLGTTPVGDGGGKDGGSALSPSLEGPASSPFSTDGTFGLLYPSPLPPSPYIINNSGVVSNNGTVGNGDSGELNSAPQGSMWIEPSSLTFSGEAATVGTRFNVTVWLNMTGSIYAYEIGLRYNRSELRCTGAGYTGDNSSQYFSGHSSDMPPIVIDVSCLGNGSVLAGESLFDYDTIEGPRSASLIWIEFEILNAPSGKTLTGRLDLTTEYPEEDIVLDPNLQSVPFAPYDASITITP